MDISQVFEGKSRSSVSRSLSFLDDPVHFHLLPRPLCVAEIERLRGKPLE